MLARDHRMRRPSEFRLALRGRRAGRPTVVVHLALSLPIDAGSASAADTVGPRIGFIVSRAVGGATVRNRVRRRLRHLLAARVDQLPAGSLVVLRALPAAASASHGTLSADIDAALRRVLTPAAPGTIR